MGRLKAVTVQN